MKKYFIGYIVALLSLGSCSSVYIANAQNESSGLIGCHPKEITIEKNDFSGQTWTATCKNTKFYCNKIEEIVNCKEAK